MKMKRNIIFIISLLFSYGLYAQSIGGGLRAYIQGNKTKSEETLFAKRHSERVIDNKTYISTIAKLESEEIAQKLRGKGCIIHKGIREIYSLYIPIERLEEIIELEGIINIELSRKIGPPLVKKSGDDLNADLVRTGVELSKSFTGKDVIIGITDWGFDYTHPNFYDMDLDEYRIIGAWDQFKKQGPSPSGFSYGREYMGKAELVDAGSDTNNIYDVGYHGTHVAGIAAGGGAGKEYYGIAPDAELLFATFLIDEAAILDAYIWMRDIAESHGKRLVINGSWGLYNMGIMDGTSLFDQAINALSLDDDIVFVSSGGNNGDRNFHIHADLENNMVKRSCLEFDFNPNPHYWGQSLLLIGDSNTEFSSRLEIYDGLMNIMDSTQWTNTSSNDIISNGIIMVEGDSIIYRMNSTDQSPDSKRPYQEWEVRISNYESGVNIVLALRSNQSGVHAWNVANLVTGVGNWGNRFIAKRSGFLYGDNNSGVGEPTIAEEVISVAAHLAKPKNSYDGGQRANFSSLGPRIDGGYKPEVSAPGMSVISSINSFATDIDQFVTSNSLEFEGREYIFYPLSGTSMSGPAVSGIVTLMLEANPELSSQEIKAIIKETARRDEYTGNNLPDHKWGWGKADAYEAVKRAIELIGLKDISQDQGFAIYPNPARDEVRIIGMEDYKLRLIDLRGRAIITKDNSPNRLDVSNLEKGIYIIELETNKGRHTTKLIIP